jgi:hypothetical protein
MNPAISSLNTSQCGIKKGGRRFRKPSALHWGSFRKQGELRKRAPSRHFFAVQDKGGDSDLIQFIYWKKRMSAKIVEQTFFSRFPAEAAGIRA